MSQLLRNHIEAITPLSDADFNHIMTYFKPKRLKKHAFLIQEEQYVQHEYFILKGCLKAFVADGETGKEFIYQFGVENWWITDREAFFNGTKATINIDCLEDCELLSISFEDRKKLGTELWNFEHFLQVKANMGYTSLQKRLQIMIMGGARERYEQFIQQYPHLINRIPKAYIASYLGVSRETLSRLYKS